MGRPTIVPTSVMKEIEQNPLELEVTAKQAEDLGLYQRPPKRPRTEKQLEATKKLIERNKEWREKLKAEKASKKDDNMVQGLLADQVDGEMDLKHQEKENVKSRILFKVKKTERKQRPNHSLKRRALDLPPTTSSPAVAPPKKGKTTAYPLSHHRQALDSDVGGDDTEVQTGEETEDIINELKGRIHQQESLLRTMHVAAPTKKFDY